MKKEVILIKVAELREEWETSHKWAPGKNNRTASYDYLAPVLDYVVELSDAKKLKKTAALIVKVCKLAVARTADPLAVIIKASAGAESPKTQSRWVRALRYAFLHRKLWQHMSLRQFLEANGGVAGCAERLAANATPEVAPSKSHGAPPGTRRGAKAISASTPPRVRRRLQAAFKKGPTAFLKALQSESLPRDVHRRLAALVA